MKQWISLALLGLSGLALRAQEAPVMRFSLEEARNYAVEHAYLVQDKDLEFRKARETIRETAAMGLPQISGSFGYSYNAQIQEQPVPAQFVDPNAGPDDFVTLAFGVAHQNQGALQVSQLLLDGSYFVALQASRVFKETKRLEQEQAQMEARRNAAQSYYGVLVAERTRTILRDNLRTLQENFEETRKLYENGFTESQDVDQLELLVNSLRNSLQNAERQVILAHQLLKFNLGLPLETEIELSQDLESVLSPEDVALLVNNEEPPLERHIEYRTVLSQEKAARLQLANERASFYPKLNATFSHTQFLFSNDIGDMFDFGATNWIPGTTIGASLSWNIFSGFARSARAQKAKLDVDRLQVAKELTNNQLRLEYQRTASNYQFALDNYQTQRRNLKLSENIRDRTRRKYREGLSSSLELTQAENQLLDSQRDYVNAIQNLLNTKEELEYAMGR